MRVIAGKYKGRKLISPHGEVRPTTDVVKGSLFSILNSMGITEDARCLDVFCGSGGVGIEALSRGARSCVFVDRDTNNVKCNLDKLGLGCRVVRAEYRRALRLLRGEKFDLIFCDPPYRSGYADECAELIFKYDLLDENGVAVIEHSSENSLIFKPENCIIERRNFGLTALEFIKRGGDESDNIGNV